MGVNRSRPEMAGKGPDRRYPEMVLELLGSNNMRNKEMDETPTGVSRSRWESTGVDRR